MDLESHSIENGVGLLKQLEDILHLDCPIDELGFVHPSQLVQLNEGRNELSANVSTQFNESVFWFRDHKLAISVLALRPLYKAAKQAFMEARSAYDTKMNLMVDKSSLFHEDTKSLSLVPENNSTTGSDVNFLEEQVMKHSRALLLLSCDLPMAWNSRKKILLRRQHLSFFLEEFQLSALVLSYSPKSEQAWNHRRWLIKLVADRFQNLQEILGKESELVEHICERSKMNYRAWCHRGWLVPYMTREQVLNELDSTRRWAELHVADSSCFHYRRRLILSLMKNMDYQKYSGNQGYENSDFYCTWKEELEWDMLLLNLYGEREALWVHRRFLSHGWIKYCANANNKLRAFLKDELQLASSCLNILGNSFGDAPSQAAHAASYILWICTQVPQSEHADLQEKLWKLPDFRVLLDEALPERAQLWKALLQS